LKIDHIIIKNQTGLLCPFLYALPPISSFLDLVAMAALRRRMQVLRKIWPDKPLPPPLVVFVIAEDE
jgi:hypothetical protein